jgi:hypothetical protein
MDSGRRAVARRTWRQQGSLTFQRISPLAHARSDGVLCPLALSLAGLNVQREASRGSPRALEGTLRFAFCERVLGIKRREVHATTGYCVQRRPNEYHRWRPSRRSPARVARVTPMCPASFARRSWRLVARDTELTYGRTALTPTSVVLRHRTGLDLTVPKTRGVLVRLRLHTRCARAVRITATAQSTTERLSTLCAISACNAGH